MLQRHCRVRCIASRMKMVQGLNMRHPEAYGEPFCSLLDEATEKYAARTTFKKNQVWRFFFDEALRVNTQADIVARMGVVLASLQNHLTAPTLTLTSLRF